MSASTVLLEELARRGELENVRANKGAWQVRVHPFPSKTYASIHDAIEEAERRRKLRDAGVRYLPRDDADDLTLGEWREKFLDDKRTRGGRKGPLRGRGLEFWERSSAPWAAALSGEEATIGDCPLAVLSILEVDDRITARAAAARTSARNELQAFKAILRYARKRGAKCDDRLLELEPVVVEKRRRPEKALRTDELLVELAAFAPEHSRRALLLMGRAGFRLGELLTLEDGRVNLEARTITIPAELCKEGREKIVPLTTEEANLVAEQMMIVRPSGTRLVFCRPGGTAWRREHFYGKVLRPARERASKAWREERELPADAPTPFDQVTNHGLRHTAISAMRRDGIAAELVAERVGHGDGGALIHSTYRHVGEGELRAVLDELETADEDAPVDGPELGAAA